MANTVIHKASTRGFANHGWLQSYQTFSFANYYDPERVRFGALRVLNDDSVAAGMGFGTHPHDNMEIISIPLEGDLEKKESMGNIAGIKNGDVQVMSAGKGISHSEMNKSTDKPVKFLQIWVFPISKMLIPATGKSHLSPTTGIIVFNKSFLRMKETKACGFTRMPGFTWASSIKGNPQIMN